MGIPRPDTNEVVDIVEEETNMDWGDFIDEPDKIRLATGPFQFDVVWDGDCWRLELYDLAYSDDEPKWAEGGFRNATEVKNALPGFIPTELRH